MTHIRLDGRRSTLLIAAETGRVPSVLHWGSKLAADERAEDMTRLGYLSGANGAADVAIGTSLAMEPGLGLLGPPGIQANRGGLDWCHLFRVTGVSEAKGGVTISCADPITRVSLTYLIVLHADMDVLTIDTTLTNEGDSPLALDEMMTATLPIPQRMEDMLGFTGRWSKEFQMVRMKRHPGSHVRDNRRGRTSHDSFPGIILCRSGTTESAGEAYGVTLAWSGNHRVRVDTLADGRTFVALGALSHAGEIRLAPGDSYASPQLVGSFASDGLSGLSQNFHAHVRQNVLRPETRAKARPVNYNCWEAVYYDHDMQRLQALASKAAKVGVERFVLDDGWFGSRRDDKSGLGDWTVSSHVYPDGLAPLVDHVRGLGMEMGIWFEPEMVNPDSDLYRAHPDWVMEARGIDQVPFRNQYVLDLSRQEVTEYLFGQIDAILTEYDIGYVKWDMNRDMNHPAGSGGAARSHEHTVELYKLIDRLRAAHPAVEIESCASGGGRIDYGILARTDRVWTSDSNDALDRQMIQRGGSHFIPLEVMGAHVGPRDCHITKRNLSMEMRAGTAIMGHMGAELNLLDEPDADLSVLADAIKLYKQHRDLLHTGRLFRADLEDLLNVVGVVSEDCEEALYSVAYMRSQDSVQPPPLRIPGLNPDRTYRVKLIWPHDWTTRTAHLLVDRLTGEGIRGSGAALGGAGVQLPLAMPETVLLLHLEAQD